nr:hypothetical protein [Tanacetum cinerariifolium]
MLWNSLDDEDVDAQEKNKDDDEGDECDEEGESEDGKEDDDDESDDDDEETESDKESDGDKTRQDESFDTIPRTPEHSEDDGNGEEDQGLRISDEVLQNLPTFDSVFRFDERLKSLEASFSEYRQTNPFAKAALVEAYEADKIILDTYGERVILKRRRNNDDDQSEGPSARSDRGSKRQREGKEPESASTSLEPATKSTG